MGPNALNVLIGRKKVCFQQLSESCCADRRVSQIIWQSVERRRTSDSECPTTVKPGFHYLS